LVHLGHSDGRLIEWIEMMLVLWGQC